MNPLEPLLNKILNPDEVSHWVARQRVKGRRIVFTNGVFDILHRGHVTLLAEAARLGDVLILGLNADVSVRTLGKGPGRPVNGEADRAFVLAGLTSVAAVVIFNDSTPYELIRLIEPDVLVKGGDYNPDQKDESARDYVVGSDIQRRNGCSTVTIDLVEGYSTTSIIKRSTDGQG